MKPAVALLIFSEFALGSPATPARLGEPPIQQIRARYARVNQNLKSYTLVRRDLDGHAIEGGTLDAYFSGPSLRKITTRLYGCSSQWYEEFYFWDGRLFFAHRVQVRYAGIGSWNVVERIEDRFYFADGRLIRWLDNDKELVSFVTPEAHEVDILENAREWLGAAQAARRQEHRSAGRREQRGI